MKHVKKNKNLIFLFGVLIFLTLLIMIIKRAATPQIQADSKQEAYWKQKLTAQQYYVLHENGTDIPFSYPEMLHEKRKGTYVTADCSEPVFRSEQKFDSGTGWPSFWAPISDEALLLIEDGSEGMERVEVRGKKCNTHLGHVFDDGPEPTGKRYCINASALKFIPDEDQ